MMPSVFSWLCRACTRQGAASLRRTPRPRRSFVPQLLVLEDRLTPSTLPVTSVADNVNQRGTLRYDVAHAHSGDTIESNRSSGGIEIFGGTVTLSDDTVQSNSTFGNGGGILITGGTVTLCGDTVQANSATGLGGGMYIASGATVYIDTAAVDSVDPTVVSNNTDSYGMNSSTANIDGSYIPQNC